MRGRLEALGYKIKEARLSPHHFGIPQIRDRIYIVGCQTGLKHFNWPTATPKIKTSIVNALQKNPKNARPLSAQVSRCLKVWQRFIRKFPKNECLPTFPVWSMEFGATYPYENKTPFAMSDKALFRYKGCHGIKLGSLPPKERLKALPTYARLKRISSQIGKSNSFGGTEIFISVIGLGLRNGYHRY